MPVLTVHLDKITNLADEDHIGKSDPYVKVRRMHKICLFATLTSSRVCLPLLFAVRA